MSVDHRAVVDRYIRVWNLPDEERPAAMKELFTDDVHYVDPLAETRDRAALDAYIGATARHFPDMRFTARGPVNGHHGQVLFGWECGAPGAAPAARGTDVAVLDGDRIAAVYGFFH